ERSTVGGRQGLLERDAKGVTHRGHQVFRAVRLRKDACAVFVGFAHHLATVDSTSADNCAPTASPMIASRIGIDPWRAAELAHPKNHGVLQEAATTKVGHQCTH